MRAIFCTILGSPLRAHLLQSVAVHGTTLSGLYLIKDHDRILMEGKEIPRICYRDGPEDDWVSVSGEGPGALLPRSPLVTGNDAQSTRGSPGDSDSYACEPSTFGFRPSGNHMAVLVERETTVAVYRTYRMTGQRGAKGPWRLTVPT